MHTYINSEIVIIFVHFCCGHIIVSVTIFKLILLYRGTLCTAYNVHSSGNHFLTYVLKMLSDPDCFILFGTKFQIVGLKNGIGSVRCHINYTHRLLGSDYQFENSFKT